MHTTRLSLSTDSARILTGDILVCRGDGVMAGAIERVTSSDRIHAAMAGWMYSELCVGRPFLAETIQQYATRIISLAGEVRRFPGWYDVYRVKGQWDPDAAWQFMCDASGGGYGWRFIARTWLRRRIGRRLIGPIPNSDDPQANRHCAALVHAALRAGGGPQVEQCDCDVVPGHYTDERWFEYIGTLFP